MSPAPPLARAACVGGGVIGAGWVARLLLNGVDVALFDPDPHAAAKARKIVAQAERAMARLTTAPLPEQGRLTFAGSLEEAVAEVELVQESVPERLDLKRRVLAAIDRAAPPQALIGSSTSGFLPSDLQDGLTTPERLVVAHPFNPVYLLPAVEIVAGKRTSTATVERAKEVYDGLGMQPVVIAKEIPAFVGDRLLEALWREALWLVRDDVATVEEIDEVIRGSFGLRWAQMGLFETYRLAGGDAGMRHFLAQFGPALTWPWTRLTDVPALDEALIEKIAAQSDAQAQGRDIEALTRIRDDNLVRLLQALKAHEGGTGWGAGAVLRRYEDRLQAGAQAAAREAAHDLSRPLRLLQVRVPPSWIDYNGHMTEHRYLQVCGEATDAFLRLIGADNAYLASGRSYYTVETHLRHLGQAMAGELVAATTQVLAADEKRLHLFHELRREPGRELLATGEHLLLHVDAKAARAAPAEPSILARLQEIAAGHRDLPQPAAVGRKVGQRP